ncbi:isochorismatase family protein [Flexivirga oryzae]|uniref:Nicotinamidase-related amidase n=1 Tax=Flexivirga oryzae TaxID=1794944 RepID=A0A839N0K7_9MICO|nr:isochorismatase family protein [Flexivirga oryzae]MBB2891250.1 nicotinamidase-related amidase [Flexivirga oryzae]
MTHTAILVIDIQQSFTALPRWRAVSDPHIATRAQLLVDDARRSGDEVIWILHAEPGTGTAFDPSTGLVEPQPGLDPADSEPVLIKTSRNAFTTTRLQQMLTEHGVRRLRVCGIQTEQCCETTARLAADLGYDVDFVIDATATFPIPHRDANPDQPYEQLLLDPRTLGTAAVIERTEYALAGRFARILTIDDVRSERAVTVPQ